MQTMIHGAYKIVNFLYGLKKRSKTILFLSTSIIVIVGGSFAFIFFSTIVNALPKVPNKCLSKTNEYEKWICLKPYFRALTMEVSASYAIKEAKKLKHEKIIDDCHLLSHFVGEASLEKHNFDAGKAFSSCEFGCIEGCYHGVMEGYLRYETDPRAVIPKVKNLCDNIDSPDSSTKEKLLRRQCLHGIGHGLLAHDYLSMSEAVKTCRSFNDEYSEQTCLGGAMMEYMEQYLGVEENYLVKILPGICAPVEKLNDQFALNTCIANIGVGLMFYTKHDLVRSKKMCEELQKQLL